MDRLASRGLLIMGFLAAVCAVLSSCPWYSQHKETIIRVGWPTTWATLGQVMQALQSLNILEKNGLKAQFTSSPDPAGEAASGNLDVVSAAAPRILKLVAESRRWVIISRSAYMRVAILVPPSSRAKSLADLNEKPVGLE